MYLCMRPISHNWLHNWLPRWNHVLTHLRFIHNWVINRHPMDGCAGGCWFTVALWVSDSSKWPNHLGRCKSGPMILLYIITESVVSHILNISVHKMKRESGASWWKVPPTTYLMCTWLLCSKCVKPVVIGNVVSSLAWWWVLSPFCLLIVMNREVPTTHGVG